MDVVERLKSFIESETRSCSMDFGAISPEYVFRMWGGNVSIEDIKARYDLDQSAIYAADFVKQSPIEKLYTFTLTEPVMKQFTDLSSNLLRRVVDKRFKSLEMLEEIL